MKRELAKAGAADGASAKVACPHARLGKAIDIVSRFIGVMRSVDSERVYHAHFFLRATERDSFPRLFAEFQRTEQGVALTRLRPASRKMLDDRQALRALPEGALGRVYAQFADRYDLDEDFYLEPQRRAAISESSDIEEAWFRDRVEAAHDLRHVLTGYNPDVIGEICLLMFRFAQLKHFGMLALACLGVLHARFMVQGPVLRPVIEAYWRGRRAGVLDLLPWEDGLTEPLAAHRKALGLTAPRFYPAALAPKAFADKTMVSFVPPASQARARAC